VPSSGPGRERREPGERGGGCGARGSPRPGDRSGANRLNGIEEDPTDTGHRYLLGMREVAARADASRSGRPANDFRDLILKLDFPVQPFDRADSGYHRPRRKASRCSTSAIVDDDALPNLRPTRWMDIERTWSVKITLALVRPASWAGILTCAKIRRPTVW
jgi:hypothetical protein